MIRRYVKPEQEGRYVDISHLAYVEGMGLTSYVTRIYEKYWNKFKVIIENTPKENLTYGHTEKEKK